MEVLKVKKWKEKKDDLPQFEVIVQCEINGDVDLSTDEFTELLCYDKHDTIKRVLRTMDGRIFELGKVFWHKKGNTLKITEFHEDLICVSYQCNEFDGTIEIDNIIINDDEFIGFI